MVYSLAPLPQVFYKILLSSTLVVAEAICLLLISKRRSQRDGKGWLYFGLMEYLVAAALAIGYFGGALTYGY